MKSIIFIVTTLLIISICIVSCSRIFRDSEPPESIVQPPLEASKIVVVEPIFGIVYSSGDTLCIKWTAPTISKISLKLYRKSEYKLAIIENIENNGSFDWMIPNNIPHSNHYLVKVMSHNNENIYEFSGQFGIQ